MPSLLPSPQAQGAAAHVRHRGGAGGVKAKDPKGQIIRKALGLQKAANPGT